MPFLFLVRGALVNAGGTARFNPQISRQISWSESIGNALKDILPPVHLEKKSVLFKVLDTDFITSIATLIATVPCKGPEQLCITGPKNTHEGSGTNSP